MFTFGNKSAPRPPRVNRDIFPNSNGLVPAPFGNEPNGASTFADINQAPLTGQYHMLPKGTKLPNELGVVADGIDVVPNSPHPNTHHTIYNTVEMSAERFAELFSSLPWQYVGKKK